MRKPKFRFGAALALGWARLFSCCFLCYPERRFTEARVVLACDNRMRLSTPMKLHHTKIGLALSSAILLSGLFTTPAFAQSKTDVPSAETQTPEFETVLLGFQSVKWGDSMATASEKMGILKTFKFSSELSNKETLFYTGGELGGQKVGLLGLSFTDEGFARAMLLFEGDENKILSRYKENSRLADTEIR